MLARNLTCILAGPWFGGNVPGLLRISSGSLTFYKSACNVEGLQQVTMQTLHSTERALKRELSSASFKSSVEVFIRLLVLHSIRINARLSSTL